MNHTERTRLLIRMADMFRRKAAGTSEELQERLGISRATFFRYIEMLEEHEKRPVVYDKTNRRYQFQEFKPTGKSESSPKPFSGVGGQLKKIYSNNL